MSNPTDADRNGQPQRAASTPIDDESPDDLVSLRITMTRAMMCSIHNRFMADTFQESVENLIIHTFTDCGGIWQ